MRDGRRGTNDSMPSGYTTGQQPLLQAPTVCEEQ
jgi:hypothetical protein